jgi:tetratricopeptide (TPR) repeat protein
MHVNRRTAHARSCATWVAALVSCCAAMVFAFAAPPGGQRARALDADEQAYVDLVTLYCRDVNKAVGEMVRWPASRVEHGAAAFERRTTPESQRGDVAAIFAAVMLHTDVGLVDASRGRRLDAGFHLSTAATMMNRLDTLIGDGRMRLAREEAPFSLATWALMVSRVLNGLWGWGVQEYVLAEWGKGGVKQAVEFVVSRAESEERGLGAEILLALASLEDGTTQMERREQRLIEMRGRREEQQQSDLFSRRLEQAEHFYRRALELDSTLLEARLRLGRLLLETKRSGEAQNELRHVLSQTSDPRQIYLACLFLGQIEEQTGRIDQAVGFYERALAASTKSQAAQIALANAREKMGDVSAARSLVVSFFADPGTERGLDPWSEYLVGEAGAGGRTRDEMRAKVISFRREAATTGH